MPKKIEGLSSQERARRTEKVKVVHELSLKYPLKELLKLINIPKSSYFYLIKSLSIPDKYAVAKQAIQEIYHKNKGRYGHRKIVLELKNKYSISFNHKTVYRLMNELNLKCLVRIKKYKSYRGGTGKIAPNILQRDFKSEKQKKKVVTDVTEFKLFDEKIYFSPILDLFNGEILSYSISKSPNMKMIKEMLEQSNLRNAILHSDQGWQYQQRSFQDWLKASSITQSMSRKGNCLDNACIESFFGTLKSELFHMEKFTGIDQFIDKLKEYIYYYNNERIQLKLKGLSPVQYRTQSIAN